MITKMKGRTVGRMGGGWVLGQEAEEERMGGGRSRWVGGRRNRG